MAIKDFFTPTVPQSHNLGRLAKGERKGSDMVDLTYFRFQTDNKDVQAAFQRVYGDKPTQILFKFPHVTLEQSQNEFMENTWYIAALASHNGYYQVAKSDGKFIVAERYWVKDESGKLRTKWRKLNEGEKLRNEQGYLWTKSDGSTQLLPWDIQSYIELDLIELNAELTKCNLANGTVTLWIRAHNELNTLVQNMAYVIQKFESIGVTAPQNSACPLMLVREDEIINAAYGGGTFAGVSKTKKSLMRITPSPQLAQILGEANRLIQENLVLATVRSKLTGPAKVLSSPATPLLDSFTATTDDFNSILFGDDYHETTTQRQVPAGLTQSTTTILEQLANANGMSLKNPVAKPTVPQLTPSTGFDEEGEFTEEDEVMLQNVGPQMFGVVKVEPHLHMDEFSTHVEKDKARKPTTLVAVYRGYNVSTNDVELVDFASKCVTASKIGLTELIESPLGKLLGESASKIISRILAGDGTSGEFYDAPLAVVGTLLWAHGYKNISTPQDALQQASKFYKSQMEELPF